MKNLYVLKIGGSIITYKKEGIPRVKSSEIQRIAQEIKKAQEEEKFSLILVHGVGSFGHPRAQKYKLWQGLSEKRQFFEFAQTKLETAQLNQSVLKAFLKEELLVFPLQPSALISQSEGKIKTFFTEPVRDLLAQNFIPVLYGDVVLDGEWRGSICSGDTMAVYLAQKLGAEKVFFATDVDGVFNQDPHLNPKASLIKIINQENFTEVFPGIGKSKAQTDAGGGMRGKILEIKRQISHIPVRIFNGTVPGKIYDTFKGKEAGTLIRFRY